MDGILHFYNHVLEKEKVMLVHRK